MDFDAYEKLPGVRWSTLKHMRTSALHYQHASTSPPDDKTHWLIGRATHAYVLEPDTFPIRYVCWSGRRQGKLWDAFEEQQEAAGKTILTLTEWGKAMGAGTAVLRHPVAMRYLDGDGPRESVVTWTDEETGMACKARLDYLWQRVVELKSTLGIEPRRFASIAARLGYHAQIAMYRDGARANGIVVARDPVIITVESTPPHDVAVYRVPNNVVELGQREYRRLLARVRSCLDKDEWPGVAGDVAELDLPEWAWNGEEPRSLTLGGELVEF